MNLGKFLAFSIGPIGNAVLGIIALPILAWLFTQEDIARYSLLHLVIGLSVLLCSLGLDQAYVRNFHESKDKATLFFTAVTPGIIGLILLSFLFFRFSESITELIFSTTSKSITIYLVVSVFAAFIARFLSLILRMEEKAVQYSFSQLLPKTVLLLIVGILLITGSQQDFTSLVLAHAISLILVILFLAISIRHYFIFKLKKPNILSLQQMLSYGFPLIFSGLAFWGLTAIDKFFIKWLSSLQELSIYAVAMSFARAGIVLQTIFSTVWAPIVFKWAAQNKNMDKIHEISDLMIGLITIAFCIAGLLSGFITYFLPDTYKGVDLLIPACLGFPLFYSLSEATGIGIAITKKSKFNLFTSLLALFINVLLNFYLIPLYGAKGAAAATIVSFWTYLLVRTLLSNLLWQKVPLLKVLLFTLPCLFLSIMTLFVSNDDKWILQITWLLLLTTVIFFYYERFINLIKTKGKLV